MKGIGWIVILIAMLTVGFLVVKDLDALRGGPAAGEAVLQPLERANEASRLAEEAQKAIQDRLDKLNE